MISILKQSLGIATDILPSVTSRRRKNSAFHFAFGFKKNKLIAIGQNDPEKTNTKAIRLSKRFKTDIKYPYMHAETDLISRLWGKYYIDKSLSVVVVRLNRNGELRNSKPCKRCNKILKALDITKVWWSTNYGFDKQT